MNCKELNYPIIEHKLHILRDKNTDQSRFRKTVTELTSLLIPYVIEDLELKTIEIETPIQKMTAKTLKNNITIIPILRAGLGMSQAFTDLIPEVKLGHIGVQRNPKTLKPEQYYFKIPDQNESDHIILVDPMLATGGSIIHSIKLLNDKKLFNIKIVTIISAPEGIKNVNKAYPDLKIYTAKIDEALNEDAYIIPGLGDAGDRIFGTLH